MCSVCMVVLNVPVKGKINLVNAPEQVPHIYFKCSFINSLFLQVVLIIFIHCLCN